MKANELRIGNWVNNYRGNPEKMEASEISEFYDGEILDPSGENTFVSAIPLTEEWLLKFGFCKVKNSSSRYSYRDGNWVFNNFWITEEFKPCIENYRDDCMNIIGMKLHFVHQLQNLYFALTGKELEYEQN
jgi:hypothetical protein